MKWSNPRNRASFDSWPIGGSRRAECQFWIQERIGMGVRCCRATKGSNGQWRKPKVTHYETRMAIVDGDDGKTYVLAELHSGAIVAIEHNLKWERTLQGEEAAQAERLLDQAEKERLGQ